MHSVSDPARTDHAWWWVRSKVQDAVWGTELTPTQKLVLLAMMKPMNVAGGGMRQSVATIAAMTGFACTAVSRALAALRAGGWVETDAPATWLPSRKKDGDGMPFRRLKGGHGTPCYTLGPTLRTALPAPRSPAEGDQVTTSRRRTEASTRSPVGQRRAATPSHKSKNRDGYRRWGHQQDDAAETEEQYARRTMVKTSAQTSAYLAGLRAARSA